MLLITRSRYFRECSDTPTITLIRTRGSSIKFKFTPAFIRIKLPEHIDDTHYYTLLAERIHAQIEHENQTFKAKLHEGQSSLTLYSDVSSVYIDLTQLELNNGHQS